MDKLSLEACFSNEEIFRFIDIVLGDVERHDWLYTNYEGNGIDAFNSLNNSDQKAVLNLAEKEMEHSRRVGSATPDGI